MRTIHKVGIIMNGVTGRMGLNQHLRRSIYAIIQQGGVPVGEEIIMPDPILVGRNAAKLEQISKECGGLKWSTDVDAAIADPNYSVYFDAQTTDRRAPAVIKAIDAVKHVYCEKPTADKVEVAARPPSPRRCPCRHQTRCRAGQTLAPRIAEAENPPGNGLFRQDSLRARGIRVLGVRR